MDGIDGVDGIGKRATENSDSDSHSELGLARDVSC